MSDYNYIDIVFTVLIMLLVVRAFTRGFVKEFFSLGIPVIAVLAAFLTYNKGAEFIRTYYLKELKGLSEVVAFIGIFVIVFLVGRFVQKIVNDVIDGLRLSSINKVLGAIFGAIEGITVVSLVLFLLSIIRPIYDANDLISGSLFGSILMPWIQSSIPQIEQGINRLDNTTVMSCFFLNLG